MRSARTEHPNATLASYLEKLDSLCLTPLRQISTNRPRTPGTKAGSPLDTAQGLLDAFCATKQATEFEKLALAFKCLYLGKRSVPETVDLVKKHQHYVVYLSSRKLYKPALEELSCLYNVLNSLPLSNAVNYETLLAGVPPTTNFDARLIVSFHFFVIQSILQMVSAEVSAIAKRNNAEDVSVIKAAAELFLHGSNFDICLASFDAASVRKYYSNGLKMLSGFVKVTDHLHSKTRGQEWSLICNAFQLKVAEYRLLLDAEIGPEIPAANSSVLSSFYRDLKDVIVKKGNTPETLLRILGQTQRNGTTDSHPPAPKLDIDDDHAVLAFLKSASICTESISSAVAILNSQKALNGHPSSAAVLEGFIRFLKSSVTTASIFSECLKELIPLLSDRLAGASSKHLRTLSKLCFERAKEYQVIEGFQAACAMEISCMKLLDHEEDHTSSRARIEFSISALIDGSQTTQVARLTTEYVKVSPHAHYSDVFPELIAACISLDSSTISRVFGKDSTLDIETQNTLFRDILTPLKSKLQEAEYSVVTDIIRRLPVDSQLSAQYDASQIFGLSPAEDSVHTLDTDTDDILAAGLKLNLYLKDGLDPKGLETVENHVLAWIQSASEVELSKRFKSFQNIVTTLSHLGASDICINLLNKFKASKFNDSRGLLDVEILLGRCLLEVPRTALLAATLKASSALLKTVYSGTLSDYDNLVNLKMTHLEYAIKMHDEPTCVAKFDELEAMITSRAEYSLTAYVPNLSVRSRISCFVTVARLSGLAATINILLGKSVESLKSSKLSIKLLSSVLRKLESSVDASNEVFYARRLLLRSHKDAFRAAKHVGLSKEAVHHAKEFSKVNSSFCSSPFKTFNNFVGAHYLTYVGCQEEAEVQYDMGYESTWNSTSLRLARLLAHVGLNPDQISEYYSGVISDTIAQYYVELETPATEYTYVVCASEVSDVILDTECLIMKMSGQGFVDGHEIKSSMPESLTRTNFQARLKMAEVESRFSSSEKGKKSVGMLPHRGTYQPDSTDSAGSTYDALIECKSILEGIVRDADIERVDISTLHDVYYMLTRCMFHLSACGQSCEQDIRGLLQYTLFIKDHVQSLPITSQKALLDSPSVGGNSSVFPALGSNEDRFSVIQKQKIFYEDLHSHLPATWTVVLLDVCQVSGNLIITRLDAGSDCPVVFDVPFDRRSHKQMDFEQVSRELQSLIQESNKSTKAAVTSMVRTKEDRRVWWANRFDLDSRLESLLSRIEQSTIGGLSGIFSAFSSNGYEAFKVELNKVWHSAGGSEESALDDAVAQLFYHACLKKTFGLGLLDDLTEFALKKHMPTHALSQPQISSIAASISKIKVSQPSHNGANHLVLIPGHSCSQIPWESMTFLRHRSVSRMPSVSLLLDALKKQSQEMTVQKRRSENVLYVLNPGSDLKKTQTRFEPIFDQIPDALGVAGQCPTEEWLTSNLFKSYIYVYLGHGGGEQYMRTSALFKSKASTQKDLPATLLMGCSSLAHCENGRMEPTSNAYNWLVCGSPTVMTNLWDITDKDIDIFTLSLLSEWGFTKVDRSGSKSLARAMVGGREACTLKYLNGAAPILHGIPLKLG